MAQVNVQTFAAGDGDPATRLLSEHLETVPDPTPSAEERIAALEARVATLLDKLAVAPDIPAVQDAATTAKTV